jgi:hypothetical protein
MARRESVLFLFVLALILVAALPANAQSFRVQCPPTTITHPNAVTMAQGEPAYTGPTQYMIGPNGYMIPTSTTTGGTTANGAVKCQQVSGGDGFMTEADGTQTFMFAFGPLSGLADIAAGHAGTQFPDMFNTPFPLCPGTLTGPTCTTPLQRGDPATTDGATSGAVPWMGAPSSAFAAAFTWNGAVGLVPDVVNTINISDAYEGTLPVTTPRAVVGCPAPTDKTVTIFTFEPIGVPLMSSVTINGVGAGFDGTWTVTCESNQAVVPASGFTQYAFQYIASTSGLGSSTELVGPTVSTPPQLDGHVDPRQIMDIGPMNGNIPGPLVAFDEDDEMFLTLTNVGMIMRPDLFEQHTIHFHGYPNASSFYDGVPDASVAINIGGSFTYYYLAPDAGTYFWHCHITPPEHLQMGMVSQLHVRPRQNRVPPGGSLYDYLGLQNGNPSSFTNLGFTGKPDPRTVCSPGSDILCSATMPAVNTGATQGTNKLTPAQPQEYTYNDGDGSTAYDVEYPLQMHGFDPNFHFVGMTFNPELFADMKDKYFLLNGRSYPDTIAAGPQASISTDGQLHYSQPLPAIINIPVGGKALLRMVNLSVSEYHTLQSLGVPMKEVGFNAKLLRDQAGMNTEFYTNSITLGGGESLDVILDASDAACGAVSGCGAATWPVGSTFYLYTPQLDHLSNDAENFGGMMTEVHICNSVTGGNTFGNTCN